MLSPLSSLCVALLYDQYWFAVPGSDLLHGVHTLGEHLVPHHDHDDRHCGVYQGQRAVFQFTSLDPWTQCIMCRLDYVSKLTLRKGEKADCKL